MKLIEDKENYNISQKSKERLIDPTINVGGKCFKASEKSSVVKKLNQKALKKFEEGVFIKIL